MFGNGVVGSRQGVGIPEGQLRQQGGTPRTVMVASKMETYGVRWVDESGNIHTEIMHLMEGVWFRAPNGENYASTLKHIAKDNWFVKAVTQKLSEATPTTVPTKDAVDVLGG